MAADQSWWTLVSALGVDLDHPLMLRQHDSTEAGAEKQGRWISISHKMGKAAHRHACLKPDDRDKRAGIGSTDIPSVALVDVKQGPLGQSFRRQILVCQRVD